MRRARPSTRFVIGIVACLVIPIAGCRTAPNGASTPDNQPAPDVEIIDYAVLAKRQNERLDDLEQFYASGVIEIEWKDKDNKTRHEPQVDLDIWAQLPGRFALRVDKFEDVVLWVGSDGQLYWIFDLFSDETAVEIGEVDVEGDEDPGRGLEAMIALMGLYRLPPPGPAAPKVGYDRRNDTWFVELVDRGAPVRIDFHRLTLLPMRVALADPAGDVSLRSELDKYTSVRIPGRSTLLYPRLAGQVRVIDNRGTRMAIFLEIADSGEGEPFDRLFDLDRLMRAYPTDHVIDLRQHASVSR